VSHTELRRNTLAIVKNIWGIRMVKMNLLDITIETKRLLLKPISYNYVDEIFKEFTSEITKYMYPKPASNMDKEIIT
jgi:hypothetical protein